MSTTPMTIVSTIMDNQAAGNASSTVASSALSVRVAASGALGNNAILKAQEQLKTATLKELARLQAERGWPRARAVRELLARISTSFSTPSYTEVRRVCDHFGLGEDDAMRAIFVKHELTRLNSAGLNTLSAIEVLTRRISGCNHESDGKRGELSRVATADKKRVAANEASDHNPALRAFKRLKTMAMEDNDEHEQQKRGMMVPGFGIMNADSTIASSSSSSGINVVSNKRDRSARPDDVVVERRHSKRRR
jgi:hypothetical protein